ncbi:MAG: ACP S-malonyltransferase [Armatimonadota bacterium]
MIAFVFPGQGAQTVGMGADLYQSAPAAREVFDQANQVLGFDLARLCFEGPADELTLTSNAQPAIVTVSVACLRALEQRGVRADVAAGHSVGEYSALVCAGALSLPEALCLVRKRGQYMAEAKAGTMAAVLGLPPDQVEHICVQASSAGVVVAANFNDPSQVVVSGEERAVAEACRLAKQAGAKRALRLKVSGAFHSPLMSEAGQKLAQDLAQADIRDPQIPVVANADAQEKRTAEQVRQALVQQVTSSVRWQQSVERIMEGGGETCVEVGPGKALAGMIRRIAPEALVHNLADMATLEAAAEALARD